MLKTIVKRNGQEERYVADKLNKWMIWSSHDLAQRVKWSTYVMKTVKGLGEKVESKVLNEQLIKHLIRAKRWPEQLMAGRLYASDTRKDIFGSSVPPTVRKVHQNLANLGLMMKMPYSDEDYMHIEKMIDHDRDYEMAYFQIKQLRKKYAIRNEVKGIEYETPQFTFMRMAMHLAVKYEGANRLSRVRSFYNTFTKAQVNAPTPNYVNLGTPLHGFASCCLYAVKDTIPSLAAGDHIGYMMTAISAGIGNIIMSRSIGDPIRSGRLKHGGKSPYFRSQAGAVTANKQAGRSGADNTYVSFYDNEIEDIIMMQNPRTAADKRNRDIHFTVEMNKLVTKKSAKLENIFLFNCFTAPDLYAAQFSGDSDAFEVLYDKYEKDPNFKKVYVSAREMVVKFRQQRNEVATLYRLQIDEVNRHTPHNDPIVSSNLCVEITQPTHPYDNVFQLNEDRDLSEIVFEDAIGREFRIPGETMVEMNPERTVSKHACYLKPDDTIYWEDKILKVAKIVEYKRQPEVSTCSLAGIVITNIKNDEEYEEAAYNALSMIDECIDLTVLPLKHVKWTSMQRRNAGVGILGLAYHMARLNLRYDTPEGLEEIDKVFERHAYFCIKAALRLGKERGNAPWMHRTKWAKGWLPIDTYKRTVDELVPFKLRYPWEEMRAEIIENKGIRFSSVCAMMPTESSSKASGPPNGPYMIRDLDLNKSDSSNLLEWCAPDNDLLADKYQLAWSVSTIDQIKSYAVMQKWTDQSISADFYRDRTETIINSEGKEVVKPISDEELVEEDIAIVRYGIKSEYYMNSFTGGKKKALEAVVEELEVELDVSGPGCDSGACTL